MTWKWPWPFSASWNGVAENLPIKHSLSEAIHNSSISKIDIQSQHPTYPLEDIDQDRLWDTRPVPDQYQTRTRPVPDQYQTSTKAS